MKHPIISFVMSAVFFILRFIVYPLIIIGCLAFTVFAFRSAYVPHGYIKTQGVSEGAALDGSDTYILSFHTNDGTKISFNYNCYDSRSSTCEDGATYTIYYNPTNPAVGVKKDPFPFLILGIISLPGTVRIAWPVIDDLWPGKQKRSVPK